MARPCTICAHDDHEDIDAAIIGAGGSRRVPLETLARRYGLSPRSLARHRDEHLAAALAEVTVGIARRREDVRLADLVDRVLTQVSDAADVRDHAMTAGDGRLALMASREEREALAYLADRLGVADDGTRTTVRELDALVSALVTVADTDPHAALVVAGVLRAQTTGHDLTDLADALTERAQRPALQLVPDPNQEAPR
ncbi:hypothetical protein SAMN03159343_2078 [Klenkia marina]|uniref:Uncharacterized protein n=1 Tax=Klenkia marina TaxID=1960309 RepID=A0A1G4Y6E4_9ACTN|nr:hypothetical protein [Klenkia marina]SCX48976.1 hypothetical protein SAMN03159343_2078 [Klenkia marina]